MKKNIAVINGDGIGPEVTRQAITVLDAVAEKFNHEFEYRHCLMGAVAIDATGNPLPDETIEICLDSDAILFGAMVIRNMTMIPRLKCVLNKAY